MDMSAHRQWNEWTNLELDGAQLLCKKLGIKLPTQREISKAGVINIKLPSGASLHMFRHGPHFWYYAQHRCHSLYDAQPEPTLTPAPTGPPQGGPSNIWQGASPASII